MRDALKWILLLGGGGLLVWKVAPGILGGETEPAPVSNGGSNAADVKALVAAEAKRRGLANLMSGDEWNWVYLQIRGQEAPDPTVVWPNRDRGFKMTIDEWYSGMVPAGLSGLPNYMRY
jgi:hypothetical protein